MQSFGVNVDDDVADKIEARRTDDDGNIRSRSAVIRELLAMGLAADDVIADSDLDLDSPRDKQALIRQALVDRLDDESD
jgi:hypothetical protein